jgi:hypothetical protein
VDIYEQHAKTISLGDAWAELRRVRAMIEAYFADASSDFREAATMAALELSENVLKHGGREDPGVVTLSQKNGQIVISTQNRVDSSDQALRVRAHIEKIASQGAREMYVARMLELMNKPNATGSGLGLLRIAYEGAFELSCEVLGDRLHIQAKKRIDDALQG